MKRISPLLLMILIVLSISCKGAADTQAQAGQDSPGAKETPLVNSKGQRLAPDFTLTDTTGKKFILSSYRNKGPVLLFFWTSQCGICQEEIPFLNKKYSDYRAAGVELLSINVGEDQDVVLKYMSVYPDAAYPVLMDQFLSASRKFRIFGVPTYILINKAGYIVFNDHYFTKEELKNLD